jgi:hypothetical protein
VNCFPSVPRAQLIMQAEAEAESVRVSWGMAPDGHREGLVRVSYSLLLVFGFLRQDYYCVTLADLELTV